MNKFIKPLTAAVILSLAASNAMAYKADKKVTGCHNALDKSIGKILTPNGNFPKDVCVADNFAIGASGSLLYTHTFESVDSDGATNDTQENGIDIRYFNIATELYFNKYATAFLDISESADLSNNSLIREDDTGYEVDLSQIYVVFSNYSEYPLYALVGRVCTPFGNYDNPFPAYYSLTNDFTISNHELVTIGSTYKGIDIAGFLYEDAKTGDYDQWGVRVSDQITIDKAKVNINASYVNDYSTLNGLNNNLSTDDGDSKNSTSYWSYGNVTNRTGAYDIYAGIKDGPYSASLEFFALGSDGQSGQEGTHARVLNVDASVNTKILGKDGNIHGQVGKSWSSYNLAINFTYIPEWQLVVGTTVDITNNMSASLNLIYDIQDGNNPNDIDNNFVASAEIKLSL